MKIPPKAVEKTLGGYLTSARHTFEKKQNKGNRDVRMQPILAILLKFFFFF